MKTLRCVITGWVAPDEAQEWIGIDPADSGRGWGLAYRRDPNTGKIATEWWHWRETANEEGGHVLDRTSKGTNRDRGRITRRLDGFRWGRQRRQRISGE